jgi:hypothetical protein
MTHRESNPRPSSLWKFIIVMVLNEMPFNSFPSCCSKLNVLGKKLRYFVRLSVKFVENRETLRISIQRFKIFCRLHLV